MERYFIYTAIIFSLISCNFSDTNKRFSNGITYIIEGGKLNSVVKEGEKGFFLQPNIENVKENKKYILFIQSINSDFTLQDIKDDLSLSSNDNINNINIDSVILSDSKLKKQMKYKRAFWILIKEKDSLIGPFSDLNNLVFFEFDENR